LTVVLGIASSGSLVLVFGFRGSGFGVWGSRGRDFGLVLFGIIVLHSSLFCIFRAQSLESRRWGFVLLLCLVFWGYISQRPWAFSPQNRFCVSNVLRLYFLRGLGFFCSINRFCVWSQIQDPKLGHQPVDVVILIAITILIIIRDLNVIVVEQVP
jgi:hypothetical protein